MSVATDPSLLPVAAAVIALHDARLSRPGWPAGEDEAGEDGVWHWIALNHRHNALLWDEEDLSRRTTVDDREIAANKRAIDRHNQARNDATERVDEWLLLALGLVDAASARSDAPTARLPPGARLNSETAGSIVDRLSILALKCRAMRRQCERGDVDEAHRRLSRTRLARLEEQRADLGGCFDELLADCRAGRAGFKVYRQFKMYNDPAFNPVLAAERPRT
ncbi:DUF4254 domain-containing protein [Aquabacterium sp. J223]|uniref:DUF4254 domain-containing protein n=1 Tax=Aquabacterium sp. J223 TaxID=2898431 RepID=UPI0021ADABE3|nr:DUF4254 domain-containing protein [Aquabacterium sp. J223]UUX97514.1 DUF4254 domain-containing protein [Aquabacterium sp. J223]